MRGPSGQVGCFAAWRAAAHGEGIVTDGAAPQSGALPNWLLLGTGSQNGARARLRGCGVCPSTSLRTISAMRKLPFLRFSRFTFGGEKPYREIFNRKNRENRRNLRHGQGDFAIRGLPGRVPLLHPAGRGGSLTTWNRSSGVEAPAFLPSSSVGKEKPTKNPPRRILRRYLSFDSHG